MFSTRCSSFFIVLVAAFLGCSPSGPLERPQGLQVSGTVTLSNGTPLNGGTLILRPETGLYGATALIQSDGSFTLADMSGMQDVIPGRYQVFVSFPNPQHAQLARKVNRRYQESEDAESDISVDIAEPTDSLLIKLNN